MKNFVKDNLGVIHQTDTSEIKAGDLIIEEGKSVVKCVEIFADTLIWKSLDGKSGACDDVVLFRKVVKTINDMKEAIKSLIAVEPHKEAVNNFAREKYNEKFPYGSMTINNSFHYYSGFDILSETTLKVNYVYGAGDMEFKESFIVTI